MVITAYSKGVPVDSAKTESTDDVFNLFEQRGIRDLITDVEQLEFIATIEDEEL